MKTLVFLLLSCFSIPALSAVITLKHEFVIENWEWRGGNETDLVLPELTGFLLFETNSDLANLSTGDASAGSGTLLDAEMYLGGNVFDYSVLNFYTSQDESYPNYLEVDFRNGQPNIQYSIPYAQASESYFGALDISNNYTFLSYEGTLWGTSDMTFTAVPVGTASVNDSSEIPLPSTLLLLGLGLTGLGLSRKR